MLANAVRKGVNLHTLNVSKYALHRLLLTEHNLTEFNFNNRNRLKHSGLIQIIDALRGAVTPKIHTLILDNCAEIAKPHHGSEVPTILSA